MQVLILDDTHTDAAGHNHAFNSAVANAFARRGYPTQLLTQRTVVRQEGAGWTLEPWFRIYGAQMRLPGTNSLPGKLGSAINLCAANLVILLDLLRLRHLAHSDPPMLVMVSMVNEFNILGYALWQLWLRLRGSQSQVGLVMHNVLEPRILQLGLGLLRMGSPRRSVRWFTQTGAISNWFERHFALKATELPLPYGGAASNNTGIRPGPPPHNPACRFAYLGVASAAKGFDLLVTALMLRDAKWRALNGQAFSIQVNLASNATESTARAAQLLRQAAAHDPSLELIDGALSEDTYSDLLRRADFLILPHRASTYKHARSGVYSEAMSLGIPIVAADGTFMADEIATLQCGITFADGNAHSLCDALDRASAIASTLRARAMANAQQWNELHTAEVWTARVLKAFSDDNAAHGSPTLYT